VSSPKLLDNTSFSSRTLSAEEKQALDTYFFPGLKYFIEPPYRKEWQGFINHHAHKADPANYKIKQLALNSSYPTDPQRLALYEDHLRILQSTGSMESIFEDYSEKYALVKDVIDEYTLSYKDTTGKYKSVEDRLNNEEFLLNEKYTLLQLCTYEEYQNLQMLKKQLKHLRESNDIAIAKSLETQVDSKISIISYPSSPKTMYDHIMRNHLQSMKTAIGQIQFADQFKQNEQGMEAKYLSPNEAYNVDYTQNNVIMPNLLDTHDLSDQCMSYEEAFGEKVMDSTLPLTYQGPNAEPQAMHEKSFSSVHGVGYDGETNDAYRILERKIAQDYFKQHGKPPSNPDTESYKDFFRKHNRGSAFYDNDDDIYPM
jgi:hypothetical protein